MRQSCQPDSCAGGGWIEEQYFYRPDIQTYFRRVRNAIKARFVDPQDESGFKGETTLR